MAGAVSFNFRVLRSDGLALSGREARAVVRYFMAHHDAPAGYRVEAVNWQRPNKPARTPEDADAAVEAMEHFYYILATKGLAGLRVGPVKSARPRRRKP